MIAKVPRPCCNTEFIRPPFWISSKVFNRGHSKVTLTIDMILRIFGPSSPFIRVKYAWIEVKKCLQIKFGVNGAIEWGGGSKNRENAQKLVFLDPHRIPLSDSNDPKSCMKTHFDFNSSIFYFEIISRYFKTEKSQFSRIAILY